MRVLIAVLMRVWLSFASFLRFGCVYAVVCAVAVRVLVAVVGCRVVVVRVLIFCVDRVAGVVVSHCRTDRGHVQIADGASRPIAAAVANTALAPRHRRKWREYSNLQVLSRLRGTCLRRARPCCILARKFGPLSALCASTSVGAGVQ